jgi:hypothetical protein
VNRNKHEGNQISEHVYSYPRFDSLGTTMFQNIVYWRNKRNPKAPYQAHPMGKWQRTCKKTE